jgi:hypothetical protein
MTNIKTTNKAFYPLVLLIIPAIASQVSKDFNWTSFDFLAMGLLLFAFGLIGDLVWHKANTRSKKKVDISWIITSRFLGYLGFLSSWDGIGQVRYS